MARKKTVAAESGGESEKKTSLKVSPDLLRKARMVSLHKDLEMFAYIDALLRPLVERDYARMIQELNAEAEK
jgi:hypothetical protein